MKKVFDFPHYRPFLLDQFGEKSRRTGRKKAASAMMGCHTSQLSQILSGKKNLTMEQALRLADFLQLSESERTHFLLLVQFSRAGTKDLRDHLERQIRKRSADFSINAGATRPDAFFWRLKSLEKTYTLKESHDHNTIVLSVSSGDAEEMHSELSRVLEKFRSRQQSQIEKGVEVFIIDSIKA